MSELLIKADTANLSEVIGFIDGVERAANDHINSSCLALSSKSNRPARGNAATNWLQI